MPQSFVSLHHHLIFSTKNRLPLISSEVQPRLFAYIGGILRGEGCVLDAAGGMPDHVHLLVSLDKFPGVCTPGYWRSPRRGYPRSRIRRYSLSL